MRGPWHDIGSSLVGKAASMVGRHFIERWNNAIYTCFKASTKIKIRDQSITKPDGVSFESESDDLLIPNLESDRTSTIQNTSAWRRDAKAISFAASHFFYNARN